MGDSNEPELFMQNYYEAVSQYTLTTHNRISKPLISQAEWSAPRRQPPASAPLSMTL